MKRSPASPWPLVMILVGVLLIVGAGVWMLTAGNLLGGGAATEEVIITEDAYDSIPRVSLADARAAFESGSAVFLDVRDADSYAQGHIQGAISLPLDELPERLDELDPSAWIITYCT